MILQVAIIWKRKTELQKGADVTGHRHRLKRHQIGHRVVHLTQQHVQVLGIIVLEDALWHTAITDPLNHAVVVPRGQGEQGRVVCHVAVGKDDGRLHLFEARDLVITETVKE